MVTQHGGGTWYGVEKEHRGATAAAATVMLTLSIQTRYSVSL